MDRQSIQKNRRIILAERTNLTGFQIIFLHLLPGIITLVVYVVIDELFHRAGMPLLLVPPVSVSLASVPFELGYLLWQGRQNGRKISLTDVILFRKPMPAGQYIFFSLIIIGWMALVLLTLAPALRAFMIDTVFPWVPRHLINLHFTDGLNQYSLLQLMTSAVLTILMIGLIAPLIEECYFRGYLLPRMNHLGAWAPLVNTILFAVYHFATPWDIPLLALVYAPLYFIVWWKRNIYLGIVVHCSTNLASSFLLLITILNYNH